ncbi:hypothetical protein [Desulfonatronum lacustre]|uniref:hypothetical protein n=1 Tax=Desulfonatronum lacustre TaxID=66849 RepID=UPI0004B12265|nr:hypothetical protein [Desulfonatronum lacustre]
MKRDKEIIWCAVTGNAGLIVSGGPHLLNCVHAPVPIVSSAVRLRRFTYQERLRRG